MVFLDDAAIFGDADEDDAVKQALDHFVQLPGGERGVVLVDVARQVFAPAAHFVEEGFVHRDAEALGAAVARDHGVERPGCDALLRKFPDPVGLPEVIRVLELEQQAFVRLALVGLDGGVVEAELFEVGEDDEEDLLGVPGVALGLEDVPRGIERLGRGLGLDEEFRLPSEAEAVVGATLASGFAPLDDHLARVVGQARLVLHVPAERLEQRRDEINPRLGFGVCSGKVMVFLSLELGDESGEAFSKGLRCRQTKSSGGNSGADQCDNRPEFNKLTRGIQPGAARSHFDEQCRSRRATRER